MRRLNKHEFNGKFIKEVDFNTKWILFGAGITGTNLLLNLKEYEMKICYFCDNDSEKWGTRIDDIEIIDPQKLPNLMREYKIIISSENPIFQKEIKNQLQITGCSENIYDLKDVIQTYEILLRKKTANLKKYKIHLLRDLLADEKSKKVLDNIILYRATGDLEFLFREAELDEYFPNDIINLTNKEVFVDAGAYDGDTLVSFLEKVNYQYGTIYSFEPDTRAYSKLRYNLKQMKSNKVLRNIKTFEIGLSNSNKKVKYTNTGHHNSKIDDNGEGLIEVVSLDSFLGDNEEISFIKMDIEGEELNALLGAQEIIKKHKPKLAICIYHKFDDLWEIPLLIKKLVPEYKIYIRHHGIFEPYEMYDTICYAVSETTTISNQLK